VARKKDVVGLGYVGPPLAVAFDEVDFRVVRIEKDSEKVAVPDTYDTYDTCDSYDEDAPAVGTDDDTDDLEIVVEFGVLIVDVRNAVRRSLGSLPGNVEVL